MAGPARLIVPGVPIRVGKERIVVGEIATGLVAALGVHLERLALDIDPDVAEDVCGAAVDRLQTDPFPRIADAIAEVAHVPFRSVELGAIVVVPPDVVAVEVVGPRTSHPVCDRVAEPGQPVVRDDMAMTPDRDAVDARGTARGIDQAGR